MKKIRIIQNIAITAGMITVLSYGHSNMTWRDLIACVVIIVLVLSLIAYRVEVERKKED